MARRPTRFWETKPLAQLTLREWERLCDGCGLCCLHRIRVPRSRRVISLPVACRLLNLKTCRCSGYRHRLQTVPQCVLLTPASLRRKRTWLPPTCAYRLLAEGRPLPDWHPLLTGDPASPRRAGVSAHQRAVAADDADILSEWIQRILAP